jgi:hypothetical protein
MLVDYLVISGVVGRENGVLVSFGCNSAGFLARRSPSFVRL